jgi:hypothetical protein
VQVGTTKYQGLYNKPSAVVHPGALAAGTLPQYNVKKIVYLISLFPKARLYSLIVSTLYVGDELFILNVLG